MVARFPLPDGPRLHQALLFGLPKFPPNVPHLQLGFLRDRKDDPLPVRAQHAPRDTFACNRARRDMAHEWELVNDDRVGHARLQRRRMAERRDLRGLAGAMG